MNQGPAVWTGKNFHFKTIEALRGIAAFAVCWFHLTGYPQFGSLPAVKASGAYGFLGVQVFFVVSGFVIPYSLYRGGYVTADYGRFLLKRVSRLEPPYLITVAACVMHDYIASLGLVGAAKPFAITWPQVLAHLGYVNAFLGMPWFIDVFWTLAVEFQFYLVVGLAYAAIRSTRPAAALGIPVAVAVMALCCPWNEFLLHHTPLFLMGVAAFRHMCLDRSRMELWLTLAAAVALTIAVDDGPKALAGLAAALAILFVQYSNRMLNFLGRISYSLYLAHALVAGTVVNQGSKWLGSSMAAGWLLLLLTLAAVLAVSQLMYKLVESPAKRIASSIRYRAQQRQPRVEAAAAAASQRS